MTQDTDTTQNAETIPAVDSAGNDVVVKAGEEVVINRATSTLATREQIRHVADAVIAEATRRLGKSIRPADAELLARVAAGAVKLQIDTVNAAGDDERKAKSLLRRRKQLDQQLAEVKAFAADTSRAMFWQAADRVVDRLGSFLVGAIVAAA